MPEKKDERIDIFTLDPMGIPIGRCADCVHCKFKYKDDSWHCEKIEFQHRPCEFELN